MTRIVDSTPKADGFRMPAEWEAQCNCWMVWPERPDNWRLGGKPAQEAFSRVAEAICEHEPLTMVVSANQYMNAREQLPGDVREVEMTTDSKAIAKVCQYMLRSMLARLRVPMP